MGLLTDGLLFAATLFAGTYCWVLARRVDALKDLDKGLGGAIVRMTRQIELARTTLDEARAAARESRQDLGHLSARAEAAASQLRLLLATVQDPGAPASRPETRPEPRRRNDPVAALAAEAMRAERARPTAQSTPQWEARPSAKARQEAPRIERPRIDSEISAPTPTKHATLPVSAAPPADFTQAERPAPKRDEPRLAAVPKPRALPAEPRALPAEQTRTGARPEPKGEEEILEALRTLAGGGKG